MTIDEAIRQYEKEAEEYEAYGIETECYQCAKEDRQIVEWLKELIELRIKHQKAQQHIIDLKKENDDLKAENHKLDKRNVELLKKLYLEKKEYQKIVESGDKRRLCDDFDGDFDTEAQSKAFQEALQGIKSYTKARPNRLEELEK